MIEGKGIYIWQLKRAEGGDMKKVVDRLKSAGMTHVMPKVADGTHSDTNGNWQYLPALVDLAHKAGIKVVAWQYVYGSNPSVEADRAITELRKQPFDAFVINAEQQYRDLPNNSAAAKLYCEKLRAAFPDLPIGLSSYRFPYYHKNFPFTTFLNYCDFNMPQVYWMSNNGTVPGQLAGTIKAYENYPKKPIIPTGAAFGEHGWVAIPEDQFIFVDEVKKHKLSGCNWWEYYETFHRFPALGKAVTDTRFEVGDQPPIEPPPPPSPPLTKLYYPCDPKWRITQLFGLRPDVYTISRGHNGIDWGVPVGNKIYCAWDGVVEVAREDKNGYGRHVRVRHSHGLTIYGHLSKTLVGVGDIVKEKQVIGLSGGAVSDPYSGFSSGPHLHFEYRLDIPVVPPVPGSYVYNAIDPLPLLALHEEENVLFKARCKSGELNVRSTPVYYLDGRNIVGSIKRGDVRDVYEVSSNGWYRIGVNQWVNGSTLYMERLPDPVEPEPPEMTLEERVADNTRRIEILEAK